MRVPFSILAVTACLLMTPAHAEETTSTDSGRDAVIRLATGINPQDYPCAKDALHKLAQSREKISDLSAYHPRRALAWLTDMFSYYSSRVINFFAGVFSKQGLDSAIHGAANLVQGKGGNPLAGMDQKVSGWVDGLSPRQQEGLTERVRAIINRTTAKDGSCK